jgi:hypothetical protein
MYNIHLSHWGGNDPQRPRIAFDLPMDNPLVVLNGEGSLQTLAIPLSLRHFLLEGP